MPKYIVRSAFTANFPTGEKLLRKGEALRLSCSSKATQLIARGLVVDEHVGLDLLKKFDARVKALTERVGYSRKDAQTEAAELVKSCLKRHESLKFTTPPSEEFLAEVEEFNRNARGKSPLSQVNVLSGVGEWAGYRCNIGTGCSHGCRYCFAEGLAVVRYKRVENADAWRTELLREVSTTRCRKRKKPIMFPTTHDITPAYLPAYRCHLYNLLHAENNVLIVSKPHRESIEAICNEFTSFRDNLAFRFTIGGINNESMRHWEPGAPLFEERMECLRYAFEYGYSTSVSSEPMLGGRDEAEKMYYLLEPYVTGEIWFGTMKYIGGLKSDPDPVIADRAKEILAQQTDDEIMELVGRLDKLPKVQWKDSIKTIIEIRNGGLK
jgi:DNA repair photolyase